MEVKTISLRHQGRNYSTLTAGKGEAVFLVHGFPDINRSFRHQVEPLVENGYQVFCPMLPGYEPQSQDRRPACFLNQLADTMVGLVDSIGFGPVHYIGHDWGALVGYAAMADSPRAFRSYTSMAVPHLRHIFEGVARNPVQLLKSWYIVFFQLGRLSQSALEADDFRLIQFLYDIWSPGYIPETEEFEAVLAQFKQPGVTEHALYYYQALFDFFDNNWYSSFRLSTSRIQVPTLALYGENDGCLDPGLFAAMRSEDFTAGLKVVKIPECGHFLHHEKPDEVNQHLLDHLNQYRGQ